MRFLVLLLVFSVYVFAENGITLDLQRIQQKSASELRRALQQSPQKLPLGGSVATIGEYFVQVELGSPGQTFNLQIDTGSTDLLVYGQFCNGCPTVDSPYNPKASSSSSPVACRSTKYYCDPTKCYNTTYCGFDDAYGDGSDVSGYVLQDVMTLGGKTAQVSFGSIEHSTSNFEPQNVDGIFGLSYPTTSSWVSNSPLIDFLNQNNYYEAFGMCLTQNGGSLMLGYNLHSNQNFQWSPLQTLQGHNVYYPIHLTDAKIGGQSLGISEKVLNGEFGALVDSGTTLIILPQQVFTAVQKSIYSVCSTYNLPGVCNVTAGNSLFDGYCFEMTAQDIAAFPTFSVKATGTTDLVIQGRSYLVIEDNQYYCLGMATTSDDILILGDTFMRGFYVTFDLVTAQVGFAPTSQCP
eukprot:TRINITY_DN691_c1_g1_i4.p1 TRINITY_DN691_c1_g1~~TRINITY_DN691_c1_g1_i4.p1  ORF type:complete len:407 (+),score=88.80 TRINITY_DN691_c1_g1_i4:2416-3636(+)